MNLARKAALNARDGARRMKEEKQFQERQDLARKGLVFERGLMPPRGGAEDQDEDEGESACQSFCSLVSLTRSQISNARSETTACSRRGLLTT